MENKGNLQKRHSFAGIQKFIPTNGAIEGLKEVASPKIIRRKPQNKRKDSFKLKADSAKQLCYISPSKDYEEILSKCDQNLSLVSGSGTARSQIFKTIENNDLFTEMYKKSDCVRESSIKHSANQTEFNKLKIENIRLEERLKESQRKLSRLQSENKYNIGKIQDLKRMISLKQGELSIKVKQIEQKNEEIASLKWEQTIKDDQITQFQEMINYLNRINQQKETNSSQTDDGEKYHDIELQLEQYKRVNMELSQKIKYFYIQEDMNKKLLHDYHEEKIRNDRLKIINKKLSQKLSVVLLNERNRKPIHSKTQPDIEIELELSPGK